MYLKIIMNLKCQIISADTDAYFAFVVVSCKLLYKLTFPSPSVHCRSHCQRPFSVRSRQRELVSQRQQGQDHQALVAAEFWRRTRQVRSSSNFNQCSS